MGPVGSALALATNTYEALYEAVAKAFSDEDAVGGGSFASSAASSSASSSWKD
jgi:hypothetical protein